MLTLIYDLVDDYLERRVPLRADHLALAQAAHDRGELRMAGPFADPYDRALFVWSTDDESVVRSFVENDPYVANGVVTAWRIQPWNVVIGGEPA